MGSFKKFISETEWIFWSVHISLIVKVVTSSLYHCEHHHCPACISSPYSGCHLWLRPLSRFSHSSAFVLSPTLTFMFRRNATSTKIPQCPSKSSHTTLLFINTSKKKKTWQLGWWYIRNKAYHTDPHRLMCAPPLLPSIVCCLTQGLVNFPGQRLFVLWTHWGHGIWRDICHDNTST